MPGKRSGFLSKAPLLHPIFIVCQALSQSWEGTKLAQELQGSDSQSTTSLPPVSDFCVLVTEDFQEKLPISSITLTITTVYLGFSVQMGNRSYLDVYIYMCGSLQLMCCGFGVPSSFPSINPLLTQVTDQEQFSFPSCHPPGEEVLALRGEVTGLGWGRGSCPLEVPRQTCPRGRDTGQSESHGDSRVG